MVDEHLVIVAYDIAKPKRWRAVFRLLKGYGEWLQLSIFQCRLSRRRKAELTKELGDLIDHSEDHLLLMDLGPVGTVEPQVTSLGKSFQPVAREAIVV